MVVANTAHTKVNNLVMYQAITLEEKLTCVFDAHKKNLIPDTINIVQVHAFNGAMSGYNYWDGDTLIGQLYLGTLQSGTYVIYKRTYINDEITEVYDYYEATGKLFYRSNTLDGQCVTYTSMAMDPENPFLNHIYNILHHDYQGMNFNFGNTQRVQYFEGLLNAFLKNEDYHISANDGLQDMALIKIKNEILRIEMDPILNWQERQEIFKQLRIVRKKILTTKRRVHKKNIFLYDFPVYLTNFKLKMQRYKMRPSNNILGTLYNNTVGKFLWFLNTVKENIGFSVAMAIYGPFTFYFITQPLNPHAMWAVGKVRSAYIETVKYMDDPAKTKDHNVKKLIVVDNKANNEKVEIELTNKKQELIDNVSVSQSAIRNFAQTPLKAENWDARMSAFKAMQIAYEGEMVFAARMGRIEQFETQFNFPLTAEAAWMEMEMYVTAVTSILENSPELDQRYQQFLKNEIQRTYELQLYTWQKVGQFFLDHPFIVVDQDNEQTQRNYYVGRQFVFFEKMTKRLQELGLANSAVTHKNIETIAKHFGSMKKSANGVLDSLKKNSKLFQQKDLLSSDEHRDYMKRQWEILFLQQNKKQEAASFSLQAYTWSVKNALWLLQTIYSAKRSELGALTTKFSLSNMDANSRIKADNNKNEYLENMFHNLTMEFVSIKKEMVQNLSNDKEALMRENVINNVKQYIIERDKLFSTGSYAASEKTASKSI